MGGEFAVLSKVWPQFCFLTVYCPALGSGVVGRALYRLAPGAAEVVPVCVPVSCAQGCSKWRKELPSRRPKRLPRRKQKAGQQYGDGRTGPFFAGDTVN